MRAETALVTRATAEAVHQLWRAVVWLRGVAGVWGVGAAGVAEEGGMVDEVDVVDAGVLVEASASGAGASDESAGVARGAEEEEGEEEEEEERGGAEAGERWGKT